MGQFSLWGVERSEGVIINQPISLVFVIRQEGNYPEIVKRTVFTACRGEGDHNFGAVFSKECRAKRRRDYKSAYFLGLRYPRGRELPRNCAKPKNCPLIVKLY